jgi:hypothetical protein
MPLKRKNCASLLRKVVQCYLRKTVYCYLPITKAYNSEELTNFYALERSKNEVDVTGVAFDPNKFLKEIGLGKS